MKCPTAFISGYPSYIISEIRGNIELIWWRILFCIKADPAIECCFCSVCKYMHYSVNYTSLQLSLCITFVIYPLSNLYISTGILATYIATI